MGFSTAVKSCMRQFGTFTGRARRAEYWMFYLFLNLVSLAGLFVVMIVALSTLALGSSGGQEPSGAAVAIYLAVLALWLLGTLVLMVPYLAVSARRLHDMGQSGHWLWLNLVGLGVVPFIMHFLDSQWGANQWGPDPKAAERGTPIDPYRYPAAPPQ